MLEGRAQVVQLDVGFGIPANLVGAVEMRPQPLGLSGEEREMPVADLFELVRGNQLFTAVLAYRFEHPIAWFSRRFVGDDKRFVDQARQRSSTSSDCMPLPPQTASAASKVQPPANTESRLRSIRSEFVEKIVDSSRSPSAAFAGVAARFDCRWRATESGCPNAHRFARSRMALTRAAANSSASGMPSNCRQIRATAAELSSVSRNDGETNAARATNKRTAEYCMS